MTTEADDHPLISFAVEANTIHVRDELAGQDLRLTAAEEPTIQPAMTELFLFPVDDAITVTTSKLRIEAHGSSAIWDGTGEHLGEFRTEPREFSAGEYYLQIVGAVNSYLRIADAPFSVSYEHLDSQKSPLLLEFPEPTPISLGARSLHSRPAATITVPDDPAALREAIPYLGSSIKEFSCERSWPSLRGHPPRLERGDHLDVPPNLSKPDTGVTIAVPETYADLYRIAPLAFYLGADVEAADRAELRLENGYTEPLSTPSESLEESVDELLGTCLLLDSLTRVDGYFSHPRYEYDELAPHLGFYPPNLYGESLTDQLMEYLEVSPSRLEPFLPQWPTTTVLRPRPADAELLPYALDALSRVHVRKSPPRDRDAKAVDPDPPSLVTAYSHSDPPAGTGRLVPVAFENALAHCLPAPADARLGFVTIDADRADRLTNLVNDVVSEYELAADAVSIVHAQTGAELERELARESDFLYSEVPVSSDGFECADGRLRLRDCADIGAKTFAVHGAASADAGLELLKRGAVAGLAIEEAVSASRIARLASSLLRGHSFAESARFAEIGETADYRFVGDASRTAVRCDGGSNPVRIDIESIGTDEHELSIWNKPTDVHRLGSVSRLIGEKVRDAYQLVGAKTRQPLRVTTSEVVSYLEDEELVVWLNGRPYHGESEATEGFVRDSARRTIGETR